MEVRYQQENKHHISSYLLSVALAFGLMAGIICSLEKLIKVNSMLVVLLVIALVIIGIQSALVHWKHYNKVIIGEIAGFVLLIGATMRVCLAGYLVTVNQFIEVYNHSFDDYLQKYNVVINDNNVFLFLVVIALSIWVVHLIDKKSLIILSILVILVFGLSCLFSLATSIYPPLLLIFVFFFTWLHLVNLKMTIKSQLICQIPMMLLIVICFISSTGYKTLDSVEQAKENAGTIVNHVLYGQDNLPEGDLTKYDQLLKGNEDTLKLTYSTTPFVTYLKGYVGSTYNTNHWEKLSKKVYYQDYSGILDWLKNQKSLVTQYQYNQFNQLNKTNSEAYTLQVENLSASRKYIYLPYDSSKVDTSAASCYFDQTTLSDGLFGTRDYTVSGNYTDTVNELLNAPLWLSSGSNDYIDGEKVYRYFAYQNYVDIDDATKELINEYFYQDNLENESLYTITTRIRTILAITTEYQKSPQAYSGKGNFVKYFLSDLKKGNAESYATAATLAFRAKGIPARYVEGYYYAPTDNTKTVTLTSKNSHAWVEVYVDGIGWLPIEVTPGFYTSTLPVNQVVGIPEQKPVAIDPNKETVDQYIEYSQPVKGKDDKEIIEKSVAYVSVILLTTFGLYILLELERASRRKYRYYRYVHSHDQEKIRYLYDNLLYQTKILKLNHELEGKPYQLVQGVGKIVDVDEAMLNKSIGYMQAVIFGGVTILPYQWHIIEASQKQLANAIYQSLKWYQKLSWRYWYCNDIELRE